MTQTTTASVAADANELRRVLHATHAAAAPEDDVSGIVGVLLHSHTGDNGDVLVATATDRYIMAQINMRVQGRLDEPVFVRSCDVERLVSFLRDIGAAQLSVEARALTVAGTRHGGQWASITVPLGECSFPTNFAALLEGPYPSSDLTVSFNPHLLRVLARIARRLGGTHDTDHVHIGLSALRKPMRAHIGDRARIIVMPSNQESGPSTPPPVFNPFPKETA